MGFSSKASMTDANGIAISMEMRMISRIFMLLIFNGSIYIYSFLQNYIQLIYPQSTFLFSLFDLICPVDCLSDGSFQGYLSCETSQVI